MTTCELHAHVAPASRALCLCILMASQGCSLQMRSDFLTLSYAAEPVRGVLCCNVAYASHRLLLWSCI